MMLSPCDKKGCLAMGPYSQEQKWEEDVWLGHFRTSRFYQMSRQHIISNFNFRSYTTGMGVQYIHTLDGHPS